MMVKNVIMTLIHQSCLPDSIRGCHQTTHLKFADFCLILIVFPRPQITSTPLHQDLFYNYNAGAYSHLIKKGSGLRRKIHKKSISKYNLEQ